MNQNNGVSYKNPCDDNHCFFIQDFVSGDSLIVRTGRREREKGVVQSIDSKNMRIIYLSQEGKTKAASLNEIVMLQGYVKGWLDN